MNKTLGIILGVVAVVVIVIVVTLVLTKQRDVPNEQAEIDPKLRAVMELKTSDLSSEQKAEVIETAKPGGNNINEDQKLKALQQLETK